MSLNPDTKEIQSQLATYCRNGEPIQIKGAKEDRLHNYRRLVSNVVNGALENAFPITHSIFQEDEWDQLVNEFFNQHDAQSHQIWKFPQEFLNYVRENKCAEKLQKPFLNDLLLFEWIEIEVFCMEDVELPKSKKSLFDEQSVVVMNPYHRLIELQYPIHKVPIKDLDNYSGDSNFLLVHRHLTTFKVHFTEISPFYYLLFQMVKTENDTVENLTRKIAKDLQIEYQSVFATKTAEFLNMLQKNYGVLGKH